MVSILQLPQAIFTAVYLEWLVYADAGRLDAAFSNRKLRTLYLSWISNGKVNHLENINHYACYNICIEKGMNVNQRMFEMSEWLQSRFNGRQGRRVPMVYFYINEQRDLRHFTERYTSNMQCGKRCFYNVEAITLISSAPQFSRLLPMVLELFPKIQSLELQFEEDATVFLQAMIVNHSMFDNIRSIKFVYGLYISDDRKFRLLVRQFLQLLGSKVSCDISNINLHEHEEYCRHFTNLGRRIDHPVTQSGAAWPIVRQFSQLTEFDYNLFMKDNRNDFALIPPSVHDVCAAFSFLHEVEFSSMQTSLSVMVDVVQLAKAITCIKHPLITWTLLSNNDDRPHLSIDAPIPSSQIEVSKLFPSEEYADFRIFMSRVPPLTLLQCSLNLLECSEGDYRNFLADLLLPYAGDVRGLTLTLDVLLSANALFLHSLSSFHSLLYLTIKPGASSHYYGELKSRLQVFASSLPKLRALRLNCLDELHDADMLKILQGLPCLDSLGLKKMHLVTKKTIHNMSQLDRVWRLIEIRFCSSISMKDVRDAIDVAGLAVLQVDHSCRSCGVQRLGYGRVPIPPNALTASI